MVLGPWLLQFFGIELPVVRIAGGLVVTALGWKLLSQENWSDHGSDVQREGGRKVGSFYPLTHATHRRSRIDVGGNYDRQP